MPSPSLLQSHLFKQILRRLAMLVALTILGSLSWPGTSRGAGIGGELTEVQPAERAIVLSVGKDAKRYTLQLTASAEITLDGKPATLDQLTPGMKAFVIIDDALASSALKVTARTATAAPAVRPVAPAPATPKPPANSEPGSTARPPQDNTQGTADWPQFRGPQRDGISTASGLATSWPQGGPRLLWKADNLGEGYSSVAVVGDLVLTMGNHGEQEGVIALSLKTGEQVWATPTGRAFHEGQGDGPRCVPTVDGNTVYVLGANGDLAALELASGKLLWRLNILNQFGARNITWGISESVLIDGNRLICTPGGRGATMVALDKATGRVLWNAASPDGEAAGYSSAVVADIGGVRQYIQFTSSGTIGVRASDGNVMWKNSAAANPTANCSAPVVADSLVFSSSGYGTGGALLRLASSSGLTNATQVYTTKRMQSHHGGMVVLDGYLYGSSDPGVLRCLELDTGNLVWENRSVGKGSLTLAGSMLYLRSERGPMALIEATPTGYNETGRFEPTERSGSPTWPYPVVAHGRLLLRDMNLLFCYDVSE